MRTGGNEAPAHADLIHQALSQSKCLRHETTVLHGAQREKCACVLCPVRCSIFTLRRVHNIRQCLQAKSERKKTTNVQDIAKGSEDSEGLYSPLLTPPLILPLILLPLSPQLRTFSVLRTPPCRCR